MEGATTALTMGRWLREQQDVSGEKLCERADTEGSRHTLFGQHARPGPLSPRRLLGEGEHVEELHPARIPGTAETGET